MRWKNAWLIILLCLGFAANAQSERQVLLQQAYRQFDSALIKKDTTRLSLLLQEHFRMKHSNGLTETKKELLQHLSEGFLKYNGIVQEGEAKVVLDEELAFVDRALDVNGFLNGSPFSVKLKASECWSWSYKSQRWTLKWRQSVKRQ